MEELNRRLPGLIHWNVPHVCYSGPVVAVFFNDEKNGMKRSQEFVYEELELFKDKNRYFSAYYVWQEKYESSIELEGPFTDEECDKFGAYERYHCDSDSDAEVSSGSEDEGIFVPSKKSSATSAPARMPTNAAKDEPGDDDDDDQEDDDNEEEDEEEEPSESKKRPLSPASGEEETDGARRRFRYDEPPEPVPDLFAKLEQYVANDYQDHCECIAELKRAIMEAKLPYDEAWPERNDPVYPLLRLKWVSPIPASILVNLGLGNTSPAWVTAKCITAIKYESIQEGVEALKRAFASNAV